MEKVKKGDALRIPAETYNIFIDAARDYQQRRPGAARGPKSTPDAQQGHILVKNATGGDCGRFSVLGVAGPLIEPDDNLAEFQNQPALIGVEPEAGVHEGRFVILAEPIEAGRIGRCLISGVAPVQIDVADADHRFADIDDQETGHLKSGRTGSAAIVWKETGTGVQWALVRLGGGAASSNGAPVGLRMFRIASNASGDGNYNVREIRWTDTGWEDVSQDNVIGHVAGDSGHALPSGLRCIGLGEPNADDVIPITPISYALAY